MAVKNKLSDVRDHLFAVIEGLQGRKLLKRKLSKN